MKEVRLNPYTKAMVNCLDQLKGQDTSNIDKQNSQFLTNMVQGRFLQYLAQRLGDYHEIVDAEMAKQLMMSLMGMMSQSFFAVFREKVNEKPKIAYTIALKITHHEMSGNNCDNQRTDRLYLGIVRKYFAYENIELIFKWIASNPEIQKVLLMSRFRKQIDDPLCIQTFSHILHEDKDGIMPLVFDRYLGKNKKQRLMNLVESGDWKIEAFFIQERLNEHPEMKEKFLSGDF